MSISARLLRRAAAVTTVSVLAAIGPVAAAPPVLATGLAGGEGPPALPTSPDLSAPPDLRPDAGLDGGPQPERYRSTNAGMYGPGLWHRASAGRTWYGAYFSLPGSSLTHAAAYCIDAGLKSPYPQYFTQADGQTVASAETAWALSTRSSADDAGIQAALAAIARLDENLEHDHAIPPAEPGELGAEFKQAAEAYAHITKDAADLAGPYRVELSLEEADGLVLDGPATPLPATPPAVEPAGEPAEPAGGPFYRPLQARVSVVSASGEALDGIPLEVDVSGGAVEETELRSTAEPLTFSVRPDRGSTEPVAVTVTATGLPATDVIVYDPIDPQTGKPAARVQSIVTAGEPTTASANAEHTIEPAPPVPPMTPPIVTVPPIESTPVTEPSPTQEPPEETTPPPAPETTTPPETQEPPESQAPPTQTQPAETQPPTSTTPPPPAPTTPPEASPEHRTAAPPPPPTTRPRAEAPTSDELPRTGPVGTGAALGSALLLLGCGIAALTVARGLRRDS
ncbi:hypothetical protein M3B11_00755 [Brevibacterium sp. p3-SID960]|uniref:hypothetical protein n=1 Tax=Brevibacterium sp. p3-SID960 TaxID=2916063 RepID=UPI0021A49035|nr:hypothetical protein [Brevibacterium sp. p3-SID960]MCT1689501.1 hypothetical protein [Brevibacterium sp. p3-SID960]